MVHYLDRGVFPFPTYSYCSIHSLPGRVVRWEKSVGAWNASVSSLVSSHPRLRRRRGSVVLLELGRGWIVRGGRLCPTASPRGVTLDKRLSCLGLPNCVVLDGKAGGRSTLVRLDGLRTGLSGSVGLAGSGLEKISRQYWLIRRYFVTSLLTKFSDLGVSRLA